MDIEHDIRIFDIEHVPGENAVARLQDAASLQVRNGTIESFLDIRF